MLWALGDNGVTATTQAITFAVIGAFVTLLTLFLTNRSKRQFEQLRLAEKQTDRQADIDKEARDYARQDLVAERVERATKATLTKLKKVEDVVDVTHALVNSEKTSTMKRQREAFKVNLALMHELISIKAAGGKPPTDEAKQAIVDLEHEIAVLSVEIADRLAQQVAVEERIELDKQAGVGAVEAADRQLEAAHNQQAAADSQQAVADQITAAVVAQQEASVVQQDIADQITVALEPSTPVSTPLPPPPPP